MCRKVRYPNEVEAMIALSRTALKAATNRKHEKTGSRQEVRFYLCPRCRGFHLTSAREYVA